MKEEIFKEAYIELVFIVAIAIYIYIYIYKSYRLYVDIITNCIEGKTVFSKIQARIMRFSFCSFIHAA